MQRAFQHVLSIIDTATPVAINNPNNVPATITGQQPVSASYLVGGQIHAVLQTHPDDRDWVSVTTLEGNSHLLEVEVGYSDWSRIRRPATRHDVPGTLIETLTKNDPEGSTAGTGYIIIRSTRVEMTLRPRRCSLPSRL